METIFQAIANKNIKKVQELIEQGININDTNEFGYSALHIASRDNEEDIALLLLQKGIDPNLQDNEGQTILHYAAVYNQLKIAQVSLENEGNLSIEDKYGNQPLWAAIFNDKGRNDRFEIVKLYLNSGADPNHKNNVDKSPRDICIIVGYHNLRSLPGLD